MADAQGRMLGAYGEWFVEHMTDPAALSPRSGAWPSFDAWRSEARLRVRELLAAPPATPSSVQTVSVSRHEGVLVEELVWRLPYGPPTRAFLLKPEGATGRLPGVLALHDHGGAKYFGARKILRTGDDHPYLIDHQAAYYGGRGWANELARRGYCVLANDVFAFGSRRMHAADLPRFVVERLVADPSAVRELTPEDLTTDRRANRIDPGDAPTIEEIRRYDAFAGQHESIVARSLFSAGHTWPGVTLADDRAALEVLASRSEVDPERIGCGGLSGGGLRTNYLAALDDRVRCSVSVGFMTTWRDFAQHVCHTHTWMLYVPGLPRLLDYPEVLGMRAPLPSLVQSCTEDPLYTLPEVHAAERELRDLYRLSGAEEALSMRYHEGPHQFDLSMQDEAFDWFDRWLAQ